MLRPIRRALAVSASDFSSVSSKFPLKEGTSSEQQFPSHFRATSTPHPLYAKPAPGEFDHHAVWSPEERLAVESTHVLPELVIDHIAHGGVRLLRKGFDVLSGYAFGPITESRFLRRAVFLETVAGIPGMVAGAVRHLRSLRIMRRDGGWIPTLLEEAENERMHMLTFVTIKRPGVPMRVAVLLAQLVMWNVFFFFYMVCPRLCHRFVGYLEEEAIKTYSVALAEMEPGGRLHDFAQKPCPPVALEYWNLAEGSTMRDMVLCVRRDEANHRDVNHAFSDRLSDRC